MAEVKPVMSFKDLLAEHADSELRRHQAVDQLMVYGVGYRSAVVAVFGEREAERRGYLRGG